MELIIGPNVDRVDYQQVMVLIIRPTGDGIASSIELPKLLVPVLSPGFYFD